MRIEEEEPDSAAADMLKRQREEKEEEEVIRWAHIRMRGYRTLKAWTLGSRGIFNQRTKVEFSLSLFSSFLEKIEEKRINHFWRGVISICYFFPPLILALLYT